MASTERPNVSFKLVGAAREGTEVGCSGDHEEWARGARATQTPPRGGPELISCCDLGVLLPPHGLDFGQLVKTLSFLCSTQIWEDSKLMKCSVLEPQHCEDNKLSKKFQYNIITEIGC